MVGETISHYKILEKIGQGGMGAGHSHDPVNPFHLPLSSSFKLRFRMSRCR